MELSLPRLRHDQWAIAVHPAKTKVICSGRRWGKSVMGGAVALATASQGGRVAWVVPTYRNGRALWRWAVSTVGHLRKAKLVSVNSAERTIEFQNGGGLGIYSMDNEDSIRGEAFHLVIVDEAARIPETAWTDAIQPTMADHDADAMLISTPRGMNWFWREWMRGQGKDQDIVSFRAPSSANPNPNIKRAALLAKDRVPERTYQQEWLAEFLPDAGGVFRKVREAATAQPQENAIQNHGYIAGVDWGRLNDFTVITIVDTFTNELVYLDRFREIEYRMQRGRVQAAFDRFQPVSIVAEENSMGLPIIEELVRQDLPIRPFHTSNASKAEIIDGLALAFERGNLRILNDPVLVGELQAYEAERLPSGLMRYGAPSGMHDDCVMSLAMAWYGAGTQSSAYSARYDERVRR